MSSNRRSVPCPVVASTPETAAHFFGFHDLCPWDAADKTLVILRVEKDLPRLPDGADVAQICLWTPATGTVEPVAETTAWNWQQGARQQWLPGPGRRIIYNILDHGRPAAVVHDLDTGTRRTIPRGVYAVAKDGRTAISPNFLRLHRAWPAYGYPGDSAGPLAELPADDGFWDIDLESGHSRLLVSMADIAAVGDCATAPGMVHFVSHACLNPSQTRFAFFHRFFMADGNMYTRFLTCGRDGTGLRLLADEKSSHFDWLDDETVVLWTRFLPKGVGGARRSGLLASPLVKPLLDIVRKLRPGLKQRLWKEGYWALRDDGSGERSQVGYGVLDADGHPMFSADRRFMLVDTYPDDQRRYNLMLYDMQTGVRYDLAGFTAPAGYDRDMKCDHHPRFNRAQTLACIDSPHTGQRQVHLLDLSPAYAAARG